MRNVTDVFWKGGVLLRTTLQSTCIIVQKTAKYYHKMRDTPIYSLRKDWQCFKICKKPNLLSGTAPSSLSSYCAEESYWSNTFLHFTNTSRQYIRKYTQYSLFLHQWNNSMPSNLQNDSGVPESRAWHTLCMNASDENLTWLH